jgi:hypothetical protein
MKLKAWLALSFALTFWPVISPSAEHRSQLVPVKFKLKDGPDELGLLVVAEQITSITVQVPVEERLQSSRGTVDTRPSPNVAKLGLQVWLLRGNGTVVRRRMRIAQQASWEAWASRLGSCCFTLRRFHWLRSRG